MFKGLLTTEGNSDNRPNGVVPEKLTEEQLALYHLEQVVKALLLAGAIVKNNEEKVNKNNAQEVTPVGNSEYVLAPTEASTNLGYTTQSQSTSAASDKSSTAFEQQKLIIEAQTAVNNIFTAQQQGFVETVPPNEQTVFPKNNDDFELVA